MTFHSFLSLCSRQSEQNASIFYNMIAELKNMADEAQPTAFHRFLKSLDDDGKLFRVYTQ